MACQEHGLIVHRVNGLETRVKALEKFILSALVFFALSSTSVIYLLIDLPRQVAKQEITSDREKEIRREVREEYEDVRRVN